MLFVKRRRILVTCSRRLENPAGLRLSPPLSFFLVSGILVMQMRGGGTSQPLYMGGRAGRCRATGLQGPVCNFLSSFFADKPLPPGCRAAYISVNFQIENIFL